MAYISFTKKAATKLKIDNANAVTHNSELPEYDDWVIDTVWDVKRDPWIMFYHRPTTFAIIVQPDKYKLDKCIERFFILLQELLSEHNLQNRMPYFTTLFKNINICHNNDRSSAAYMTQNKTSAYWALGNPNLEYRVVDLYGLMIRVNDMLRKKFDMKKSSLEAFIEMVKGITVSQHTLH
ncbi:MAG: DUF6933 domain-containing protein [Neisseriaceae bacterium]|jgi:hypothetical protein